MWHEAWSRDHHKHCGSVVYTAGNNFPLLRVDCRGIDIADDDHVELPPIGFRFRKAGRAGIAEGAVSGGEDCGVVLVGNFVGIQKDVLEVDGFVSAVEEVPQVAEFPARITFDDEDVGAGVGDGCFELSRVVVVEALALEARNLEAVLIHSAFFGNLREADFFTVSFLRDLHLAGFEGFVALEKGHFRGSALIALEQGFNGHAHPISEVDRFRRVDGKDGSIFRWNLGTDGNHSNGGIENSETAGAVFHTGRAVVATVGEHHDTSEFFGWNLFEDRIESGGKVGGIFAALTCGFVINFYRACGALCADTEAAFESLPVSMLQEQRLQFPNGIFFGRHR